MLNTDKIFFINPGLPPSLPPTCQEFQEQQLFASLSVCCSFPLGFLAKLTATISPKWTGFARRKFAKLTLAESSYHGDRASTKMETAPNTSG